MAEMDAPESRSADVVIPKTSMLTSGQQVVSVGKSVGILACELHMNVSPQSCVALTDGGVARFPELSFVDQTDYFVSCCDLKTTDFDFVPLGNL